VRLYPAAADLIAARPHLRAGFPDGLMFEGVPLAAIAARHGTPSWVYGAATVAARFRRLRDAMRGISIHYAVKANDHPAVLGVLAAQGAGADVVSGGELRRALAAGFAPGSIVFSGVGKTQEEMRLGLDAGIGQFNVESAEELRELNAIAELVKTRARVALRINPDVDAGTHDKISTGRAGDKFGIAVSALPSLYAELAGMQALEPQGLAVHIGSQITNVAAFANAFRVIAELVSVLRSQGFAVPAVDCGGGLGIAYRDEPQILPEAWAGAIQAAFAELDLRLSVEPGRWLAGPAGLLLTRVVRVKREGMQRPIVIVDAGMNDLARPAIYGAWHGIVPVASADLVAETELVDIAGPVCESADMFARGREIARLSPGSLLAILDAGAYGAVMSSGYNARPFAPQVLIGADRGAMSARLSEALPGRAGNAARAAG
jgi:diaminopimelate decarboxylase